MKHSLIHKMVREALLQNLLEDDQKDKKKEPAPPEPEKKEIKPDELGVTNSNPSAPDPKEMEKVNQPQEYDGTPAEQAAHLGLEYLGWSYYGKDGQAIARSVDGKLVRLDPNKLPPTPKGQPSADDPYSLGPQKPSGPQKIKLKGPSSAVPEPYSDVPPPLARDGRAQKTNLSKITGEPAPNADGTLANTKPEDAKEKGSANGGAGTHKEYVPTHGYNVTKPTITPDDIEAAERDANALEARLGKDGAIKKLESTMLAAAERLKLKANHNSNSSDKRLGDLSRLEKAVHHNKRVLRALRGEPIGEPGEANVPTHKDGTPYEVNVNGKRGIVDMVDEKRKTLYVSFDDGSWAKIPFGHKEKDATSPDIQYGVEEAKLTESDASDQASSLGLTYIGFGRYMDETGKVVAKSIDGKLVRIDPEDIEDEDLGIDPKLEKALQKMFDTAGQWDYNPQGHTHVSPGWNKGKELHKEDIPYDANGEQTVQKLLAMIGDPAKLVRWLLKTFKKETPNGKQRILGYLGIVKAMGLLDQVDAEQPAHAPQPSARPGADAHPLDALAALGRAPA